eukprot:TRINITY_DN1223_c0_g2_i1.p1 TRINITY_DN1223_c0_g2~~TRINITY_DN1223_c0_g2_i1.p1  ORF type:complete len:330 (+),score=51.35 TRINITY_DN1223_c0_g2_i1:37-990(+)
MEKPSLSLPRQRKPWKCEHCQVNVYLDRRLPCPCIELGITPENLTLDYCPDLSEERPVRILGDGDSSYEINELQCTVLNVGTTSQKTPNLEIERTDGTLLRIVCISDTHCRHRLMDIPEGDVLIHSGDITFSGRQDWLEDFNDWLGELPHPYKIVIAGNHDVTLHPTFYRDHHWRFHDEIQDAEAIKAILTNCIYIEDETVIIDGIRFYGTPWVPAFHDCAFNLYSEEQLEYIYSKIPEQTHVLITHTPPEKHRSKGPDGKDYGSPALNQRVKEIKPVVHVFGHVHVSYGKDITKSTTFVNAASVNTKYKPANSPVI